MIEIKLLLLLAFCVFSASVFLLSVIFSRGAEDCGRPCLVIPLTKDREDIELTARELVIKAAGSAAGVNVVLLDCGADSEQLAVFDKSLNGTVDYSVIRLEALTFTCGSS